MKYILIILFLFCGLHQAEAQTTGGSFVAPSSRSTKDTMTYHYSGRQYLQLNTWRGFSRIYGHSYYQFNQTMGTGATSSIFWTNRGILIGQNQRLVEFNLEGRHNNNEAMQITFEIACFETVGTSVNVKWRKTLDYKTADTNHRSFSIPINEVIAKGDQIQVTARKVTGSGTTRYFYMTANLVYIEL